MGIGDSAENSEIGRTKPAHDADTKAEVGSDVFGDSVPSGCAPFEGRLRDIEVVGCDRDSAICLHDDRDLLSYCDRGGDTVGQHVVFLQVVCAETTPGHVTEVDTKLKVRIQRVTECQPGINSQCLALVVGGIARWQKDIGAEAENDPPTVVTNIIIQQHFGSQPDVSDTSVFGRIEWICEGQVIRRLEEDHGNLEPEFETVEETVCEEQAGPPLFVDDAGNPIAIVELENERVVCEVEKEPYFPSVVLQHLTRREPDVVVVLGGRQVHMLHVESFLSGQLTCSEYKPQDHQYCEHPTA